MYRTSTDIIFLYFAFSNSRLYCNNSLILRPPGRVGSVLDALLCFVYMKMFCII